MSQAEGRSRPTMVFMRFKIVNYMTGFERLYWLNVLYKYANKIQRPIKCSYTE